MKSLNFKELNSYLHWCESILLGAQLQTIWTHDWGLVLEFYKYRNFWLVVDFKIKPAGIFLVQNEKIKNSLVSKKHKPVGLFLNSHGKNLFLEKLNSVPELGRVVQLNLKGKDRNCKLEILLIPGNLNILIEAGDKKISWNKPQPTTVVAHPEFEKNLESDEPWSHREEEWAQERFQEQKTGSKMDVNRLLEKKEKALLQMESVDLDQEINDWIELGESLKNQTSIRDELKSKMDVTLSYTENQERAFQKAKNLRIKKAGHIERVEKLKNEIMKIKSGDVPVTTSKVKFHDAIRSRTLNLENGKYALMGKSAKDNLKLLRQSRAWDYWLHLKDYPGAHVIIFREKNQSMTQAEIQKVSEWILQETVARKKDVQGVRFEVVVAECRYVKPIKGDKLGRVNYQNPQVYRVLVGGK